MSKIMVNTILSSKTVKSTISVSEKLRKYFRTFNLTSTYDEEIVNNQSILNIPVLSIVLPLAWFTKADIYVDELDISFAKSIEKVKQEYKKMYPKIPFKTKIIVKKLVENKKLDTDKTAILFSGGIDSTYSLFKNMHLNPRLIMIFGASDMPLSDIKYQQLLKKEYSEFAKRKKLKINFIRTNALEILNTGRLNLIFWKFKNRIEGDFWQGIGYSLAYIGHTSPLSINRFDKLIVAGAFPQKYVEKIKHFDSSSPNTDEKISWSNLKVKHDSVISRHMKSVFLKEFIINNKMKIHVCWPKKNNLLVTEKQLNCNSCSKCFRTITSFILANIDPNKHGFNVKTSTFLEMKKLFENKEMTKKDLITWWKPMQKAIPMKLKDYYGSEKFFEWFKKINLIQKAKKYNTFSSIFLLKCPYPLYAVISYHPNPSQLLKAIRFQRSITSK